MPKVSIIVPNYNHASYLKQRITSILNQTYQDFELIYLDDASTDNSNEVFSEFLGNLKVKAIFNKENSGSPFKQWNKGIQQAKGDYIWIAEADDYADPFFLEALVNVLDKNSNVGITYCQSWKVNTTGEIINDYSYLTDELDKQRWKSDYINNGLDECKNYLVIKNTIPNASAVVFRKDLFIQAGCAEETMMLCGDWLTWIKIVMATDIAFIAKPLNYFRYHASSVRSKSQRGGTEMYEKMKLFLFIRERIELPTATLALIRRRLLDELFFRIKRGEIKSDSISRIYEVSKKFEQFLIFKLLGKSVTYVMTRSTQKLGKIIFQN